MSCHVGESHFRLHVPDGYMPSSFFEHLSEGNWTLRIWDAIEQGLISTALGYRVINSLARMPELKEGQKAGVSFSGGKDSQVIFMLAVMKYGKENVFAMFADTKDEWPETLQAVDEFEKWIDVPIQRLESEGIHELLRHRIPCWPKTGMRHCTKETKLLPQRDWLDRNGYGQDRKRGNSSFRNVNVGNGTLEYEVIHPTPQLFSGERWYESVNRSKLEFDDRIGELLRHTHRPVLDWHIEDIWDFIFYMKAPINQVYLMGMRRAACAGCIFASENELYKLGEHYPDMLLEWVKTEEAIGVKRPYGKHSLAEIYARLEADEALGSAGKKKSGDFLASNDLRTSTGQLMMAI